MHNNELKDKILKGNYNLQDEYTFYAAGKIVDETNKNFIKFIDVEKYKIILFDQIKDTDQIKNLSLLNKLENNDNKNITKIQFLKNHLNNYNTIYCNQISLQFIYKLFNYKFELFKGGYYNKKFINIKVLPQNINELILLDIHNDEINDYILY